MRKYIQLAILCMLPFVCAAQLRVITGIVTDEMGEGIPNVSVMHKGSRTGTITNDRGVFSITIGRASPELIFSAVGYETVTVQAGTNATLHITMRRLTGTLQEVVVTGIGLRRKAHSVSYATSIVRGKEIAGLKTWQRSGIEDNAVRLSVGEKDILQLKSVQVAVKVDGFRARILFDYFFYNPHAKRLRGDFKLKLPNGASPFYFAFGGTGVSTDKPVTTPGAFIPYHPALPLPMVKDTIRALRNNDWNNVKEAVVAPKEKAAYAFNEVVRGNVDPALLEWGGADIFSCSIFPLEPGKWHRVVVGYDVNLLQSGADALLHLDLPYKGIAGQLDIDIAKGSGMEISVSPALPQITANGRLRFHATHLRETHYAVALQTAQPVFLQQEKGTGYFATSCQPELPRLQSSATGTEAVFLLDVSLSSQPDKFNVWLKTMEGLLQHNRDRIKRFAVLIFNVDAAWWRDGFTANTEGKVADFMEYAQKLSLLGATDIGNALREAAHPSWEKRASMPARTYYLLSDGDASWGENDLHQLSGIVPAGHKLYAFTSGFSGTDNRVLDHLSRQTGGAVFSVLNEPDVAKVAKAIRYEPWRIVGLSLDGGTDLLIAGRPANVFPGQKLLITGRGKLQPGAAVRITLAQGNRQEIVIIPATQVIASALVNRVYGQVAVQQLEDFASLAERETIAYATHFEVPGQTCSMVMLESNALYTRYGIVPQETAAFVDSTGVTAIINRILKEEESDRSLGNAKKDLLSWLNRMRRDGLLNLQPDSLFIRYIANLPDAAFLVKVPPLKGTIFTTDQWYPGTAKQLAQSHLDYTAMQQWIAREKKLEGTANAFKLLSSFAEHNRSDLTLMREISYTLAEWQLHGKAYELLQRVLHARPAEAPSYLPLAASLAKMGYSDLALVYYDIAFLANWDRRFKGFQLITALQYYKFLRALQTGKQKVADPSFIAGRLQVLQQYLTQYTGSDSTADLVVIITWNTDNSDVDLHLREPSGEECYYGHRKTATGGFLSNDATEGYGPEMYFLQKAPKGTYHIDLDYFSSSRVQTSAPSKVLVEVYRDWGRANETVIRKVVTLKTSQSRNDDNEDDNMLEDVLVFRF